MHFTGLQLVATGYSWRLLATAKQLTAICDCVFWEDPNRVGEMEGYLLWREGGGKAQKRDRGAGEWDEQAGEQKREEQRATAGKQVKVGATSLSRSSPNTWQCAMQQSMQHVKTCY